LDREPVQTVEKGGPKPGGRIAWIQPVEPVRESTRRFEAKTDLSFEFFIPKVILLWVLGVVFWTQRSGWLKCPALALLLSSLLLNAPRFTFHPYHDFGWYAKCDAIRRGELVQLEINPEWKFTYRRGSMESFGPLPVVPDRADR
jgi:hypothetical protein